MKASRVRVGVESNGCTRRYIHVAVNIVGERVCLRIIFNLGLVCCLLNADSSIFTVPVAGLQIWRCYVVCSSMPKHGASVRVSRIHLYLTRPSQCMQLMYYISKGLIFNSVNGHITTCIASIIKSSYPNPNPSCTRASAGIGEPMN